MGKATMTRVDQQVQALDRILLLTTMLDADMTRGLAKVGLSRSRVGPVWVLHQSGPSTQRELADALGVSARNVTGLVDALVETGFVTRDPHPSDRRATLVSLTTRGRRVADGLADGLVELARQLFENMPQRTFTGLVAGLDSLLATINDLLEEERR
jgi:DNA-binding MarR family transcriptional regulator